jgi:hypothetical protein
MRKHTAEMHQEALALIESVSDSAGSDKASSVGVCSYHMKVADKSVRIHKVSTSNYNR